MKLVNLLFGSVLERVRATGLQPMFLDLLEVPIIEGRLQVIPSELFEAFIERFIVANKFEELEECVVHLDVSRLDFDMVW